MKLLSPATLALFSFLFATAASGAVRPYYQDIKLPTQKVVERQQILNPGASDVDSVLDNSTGGTSAAARVVSTFDAQPDVPRNLNITPGGTTTDIEACEIVVAGTDILNNNATDAFVFAANAVSRVDGLRAFKTITSITFPANCESGAFGATWDVGYGEKLGMKRCMDGTGHVFHSTLNGAKEATGPTVTSHASEVSKNTADFVGTMEGTNDFEVFFMQNYRCLN